MKPKIIQIQVAHTPPFFFPLRQEWDWGSTVLYGLDENGELYRRDADHDKQWYPIETVQPAAVEKQRNGL